MVFGAIAITKPYKLIGFGAIAITKPYKFIGFRAIAITLDLESHSILPGLEPRLPVELVWSVPVRALPPCKFCHDAL